MAVRRGETEGERGEHAVDVVVLTVIKAELDAARRYPPIVDHEGKPLDEATLSRIFRPMDPALFDDPVCGAALRRLAAEDPDVIAAVADVDRALIWNDFQRTPAECLRSVSATLSFAQSCRRVA